MKTCDFFLGQKEKYMRGVKGRIEGAKLDMMIIIALIILLKHSVS
jgi:hypothetical protein